VPAALRLPGLRTLGCKTSNAGPSFPSSPAGSRRPRPHSSSPQGPCAGTHGSLGLSPLPHRWPCPSPHRRSQPRFPHIIGRARGVPPVSLVRCLLSPRRATFRPEAGGRAPPQQPLSPLTGGGTRPPQLTCHGGEEILALADPGEARGRE
jgi:hypothetical protein